VCLTQRIFSSSSSSPKFKEKNGIAAVTREGYVRAAEYQTYPFCFAWTV
jgi:hypothetical protein